MINADKGGDKTALPGLTVDETEAGQKLMNLLERRLELPQSLLHRWIRTGQVRLNGGRTQPFARVLAGDTVRLPPFAAGLSKQARVSREKAAARRAPAAAQRAGAKPAAARPLRQAHVQPRALEILAEDSEILALFKPAGLPVHPGTGHTDSVSGRLARQVAPGSFTPTPAHRIDKDTTGVLLVAKTYAALSSLHEAFRSHEGIRKEYLCWVKGFWPHEKAVLLRHYLVKAMTNGRERMLTVPEPAQGQEAVLVARPLSRGPEASLLQVRLLTGRTHQIRAQLAAAGFPVLGDGKYGTPLADHGHYLHSARLTLGDGRVYEALPRWQGSRAVAVLPPPLNDIPEEETS